ncbi:unnamed protein product [Rhizophagus irregularis]|nr:unnamed protein product [Rhizophagus irregularis]
MLLAGPLRATPIGTIASYLEATSFTLSQSLTSSRLKSYPALREASSNFLAFLYYPTDWSITEKKPYIEILDINKELRKELEDEIAENKLKDKKLKSLSKKLENWYRALSHQDSTILAHEDEIVSLKSEIKSLKQHLHKALQDLRHKSNTSTAQDIHILSLPMALPDILRNHVGTALDQVENYIDGVDTTFNPKNTLNRIRISLTTVRGHMQRQTNGQRMAFRKQNRINILAQEKAVLQILVQRRKTEADLAEFN